MAVIQLNKQNFEQEVLNSRDVVLVDFFATWCGPCKMMAPVLDEIAEEYPQYKICKVNVDEEQELAEQYNVMSIPTFIVFKNGNVVNQTLGAKPKNQIIEMLK